MVYQFTKDCSLSNQVLMVTWISIELITTMTAWPNSLPSDQRGEITRGKGLLLSKSNYAVKVYGNHLDMEDKFC